MRFRLNYLLGSLNPQKTLEQEQDELHDDEDESAIDETAVEVSKIDEAHAINAKKLKGFLDRAGTLAEGFRDRIYGAARDLEIDIEKAKASDREALQELVEEQILVQSEVNSWILLVDDLIEEVERRFEFVMAGEFDRGQDEVAHHVALPLHRPG